MTRMTDMTTMADQWCMIYCEHCKHRYGKTNNLALFTLKNSSINIESIPQIGNEELFYDCLKHFDLESQWRTIVDSPKRISSLTGVLESEFRDYCIQNHIPVVPNYSSSIMTP